MQRIVMHLDMDAFFASVEERDKPWLKGKPIVVGSDPKEGKGRGVVSTANYKAREYGIHSALPISKAWEFSEAAAKKGKPRAEFIGGGYRKYGNASHKIMDYLKTQADVLAVAGIDEAYLDVSSKKTFDAAKKLAGKIKRDIKKNQKLTASIGIGPNKLIAKIASDREKPDGLTIVNLKDVQKFLDPLPISVVPGIGPKARMALEKHKVKTIKELRAIPKEQLMKEFGKWGMAMYNKARGIDDSPVVVERERKSIGEQTTFEEDSLDPTFLTKRLKELADSVFEIVQKKKVLFRTITITVRFSNFETKTRSHTLTEPTNSKKELEITALNALLPFLDARENQRRRKIRLLGVRVEKLQKESIRQHGILNL